MNDEPSAASAIPPASCTAHAYLLTGPDDDLVDQAAVVEVDALESLDDQPEAAVGQALVVVGGVVDPLVVLVAQWYGVGEIGAAAVGPVREVVGMQKAGLAAAWEAA